MTLKKKCKKCGHTQTLKDGRKTKTSWKCSDCGFQNKLRNSIIALVALIAITSFVGLAYAEEQQLPMQEPYQNKMCIFTLVDDKTARFICTWDWLLPSEVLSQVNQTTPPTAPNDIPIYNLELADQIKLLLEKAKHDAIEEQERIANLPPPEPEPTTPEEREIKAAVDTLAECRTGLGAWAAYQETELIQNYADKTRWEFSIRDNLSQSYTIKQILLAIEECDIMKVYADMNLIGAYELNKILADQAGLDYLGRPSEHPLNPSVTDQDQNAMVATDPVTPKDIADEITEMEELRDRLIVERVFEDPDADCIATAEYPDRCTNRGGQPAGLNCSVFGQPAPVGTYPPEVCPLSMYDTHILKNWESITYGDIKQLQCDNFLYIYQHKIGTHEFPVWLNHCVPKVVRNN